LKNCLLHFNLVRNNWRREAAKRKDLRIAAWNHERHERHENVAEHKSPQPASWQSADTTSYDPRVDFGLNQVENVYNDFGQQTHSYQEHGGLVNTSTTPKVEYSYANGSPNTIRMTGMVYPDGRSQVQSYGTAIGINDASSRVESMKFSAEGFNLVDYQCLGSSGFVNAASAQPGISWTLIGSGNDPNTGDVYWGLDRCGRVDNCLWKTSSTTLAQIEYGYDRASNRTWRKDGVLSGYDELYSYDGLYRLTDQQRGTRNRRLEPRKTRKSGNAQRTPVRTIETKSRFTSSSLFPAMPFVNFVPFVVEKLCSTFSTILHTTYRRLFRQERDRAGNMVGESQKGNIVIYRKVECPLIAILW